MDLSGLRLQLDQHPDIHKRIAVKAGCTMQTLYNVLQEFTENQIILDIAISELIAVENERQDWIDQEKSKINNS